MEIKKLLAEVVKQENWGESAISLFWTDDVPRRDGAAAYDERPPEKVICLHSPKGAEAMNPDNPIVNVPPTVRRRFKMVPLDEAETIAASSAAMEQECPVLWGPQDAQEPFHPGRCSCSGTGKVFILPDSVRVPCQACRYEASEYLPAEWIAEAKRNCNTCGGRGWTVSLDRRVWEPAFVPLGFDVGVFHHSVGVGAILTRPDKTWTAETRKLARDGERLLSLLAQKEHP